MAGRFQDQVTAAAMYFSGFLFFHAHAAVKAESLATHFSAETDVAMAADVDAAETTGSGSLSL